MGNAFYNLLLNEIRSKTVAIKPMKDMENTKQYLRVVKPTKETYLLDELEQEEVYPTML